MRKGKGAKLSLIVYSYVFNVQPYYFKIYIQMVIMNIYSLIKKMQFYLEISKNLFSLK